MGVDPVGRALVRLLLVVAGLLGGACASPPSPAVQIDAAARPLPSARLTDADIVEFEGVVAGARGRPVVVNVWASWCGPCRVEAPLLDRAAEDYGAEVQFLGVASRDDRKGAEDFLRRFDVTYPNLLDTTGGIRKFLAVRGLPTTYVFDGRGRLVRSVVGAIDEQTLAASVEEALRRS